MKAVSDSTEKKSQFDVLKWRRVLILFLILHFLKVFKMVKFIE